MKSNLFQIREMEDYRWGESCKAGQDLGMKCYFEWIQKYSSSWRELYQFCKRNNLDYFLVKSQLGKTIDQMAEKKKLDWLDHKLHEWLIDTFSTT